MLTLKKSVRDALGYSSLYIERQVLYRETGTSLVQGGAIGQSLKGSVLQNITMLVTKLKLEICEQNFVTKLYHALHIGIGLYYISMSNELPQAQSRGGGTIAQSL